MSELSYTNGEGDTVFTSQYLKNKKSCCKSSCLHCPYGHTVRTLGVQVEELADSNLSAATEIYDVFFKKDLVTSNLLASAFGNNSKLELSGRNFKVLLLKNTVIGLVEHKSGEYRNHYLGHYFSDQGIQDTDIRTALAK